MPYFRSFGMSLLVCGFLFGHLNVESSTIKNFLNLNLREENTSTVKKELAEQLKPLPGGAYTGCGFHPDDCPADIIRLSWVKMPPFVHEKPAKNASETPTVTGVFIDVLHHAFRICCHPACKGNVNYSRGVNTTSSLHKQLFSKKANGIFPVHSNDPAHYGGEMPYVHVLTTPGLMLVLNKEDLEKDGRLKVWNALAGTWTVLIPSILLVVIAGICIWALEYHYNQGEFPKEFLKGAANGVWWSFVSMTTVGYGDKSPKTFFGRFFGMVWIIFGLVICSFMVATLESALTVTSMDKKIEIFGKDIAVLENSEGYIEAVHQGARVKVYHKYESAYDSLIKREVFGILEEIPFGINHMSSTNDSRLVIARLFMRDISYGLAMDQSFPSPPIICLRQLFKFRTRDISEILEHYYYSVMDFKRSIVVHEEKNDAVISLLDIRSPFYMLLLYVLMICLAIMFAGGLVHQFMASREKCTKSQSDCNDKDIEEKKISSVVPLRDFNVGGTEGNNF